MRWPWQKPAETRSSYTDALISLLASSAAGSENATGRVNETGTAQALGDLWARALSSAEVEGGHLAKMLVTPEVLDLVGRELILTGEIVLAFDVPPMFSVASSWTVWGGPSPASWRYHVTTSAPSKIETRWMPRASVIHLMWAPRAAEPWRSLSPLSGLSGTLLGALELRLGQEAAGVAAHLLPIPQGPEASDLDTLRDDIRDAKGSTVLTETVAGGWGDAGSAPRRDLVPARLGANPPDSLIALRKDAISTVASAAGVPASLVMPGGDGTTRREDYRQFVFLGVAPVAVRVQNEFARVLETEVEFSFGGLAASDLAARGRALKQLTESGVSLDDALEKVGLA